MPVPQHCDQSNQHDHDGANLDQPCGLRDCVSGVSYDTKHATLLPLKPETKDPINKQLLMKMPKDATTKLLSHLRCATQECCGSEGARWRQVHEGVVFTKKTMGAQTLEALVHASLEQLTVKEDELCHARSAQRLSDACFERVRQRVDKTVCSIKNSPARMPVRSARSSLFTNFMKQSTEREMQSRAGRARCLRSRGHG